MSLTLKWNIDADAHADHSLESLVASVLSTRIEVFHIGQIALLDAFRKAVVYNMVDHRAVVLEVDGKVHSFNEYGNFTAQLPYPVPDLHSKIICDILQGQVDKKRAAQAKRSVD